MCVHHAVNEDPLRDRYNPTPAAGNGSTSAIKMLSGRRRGQSFLWSSSHRCLIDDKSGELAGQSKCVML